MNWFATIKDKKIGIYIINVGDFNNLFLVQLQEFDSTYGPGWQCIVGTDFGSFVTHCFGCFIHFCIGNLAILLFRGSTADNEGDQFPDLKTIS